MCVRSKIIFNILKGKNVLSSSLEETLSLFLSKKKRERVAFILNPVSLISSPHRLLFDSNFNVTLAAIAFHTGFTTRRISAIEVATIIAAGIALGLSRLFRLQVQRKLRCWIAVRSDCYERERERERESSLAIIVLVTAVRSESRLDCSLFCLWGNSKNSRLSVGPNEFQTHTPGRDDSTTYACAVVRFFIQSDSH